jgi:type II secretory pathway pseudopilin PulG
VKPIHRRHGRLDDDAGISLVEILVAMMIFAMLSIGIAYALTLSLTMVSDARQRVVAANLAAQEVDLLRAVPDVFTILDETSVVKVGADTYSVVRSTNWFTGGSTDAACGAGAGTLQYKRVNISVTWTGMRAATKPVESDTVLAPDGRINDPSLGSILISVLNASGTGSEGVAVTATPSSISGNTAVPLTSAPMATDAQGCSYILKVAPGTYDVTITKSGFVDTNQSLDTSVSTVDVAAGAAASAGFQFDQGAKFNVTDAGTAIKPTNLEITYLNTYGTFYRPASGNPAVLHPFPAGYIAMAGHFIAPTAPSAGCKSVDPEAWPMRTEGTTTYVGQREPAAATTPGGTVDHKAPMGVAVMTFKSPSGTYLNAVSQASAPGTQDPGCAVGMKYTFGAILSTSISKTVTLALPFGSWKLYSANSTTGTTNLVGTAAVTLTGQGTLTAATGIITFDPRQAVTP